MLTAVLADATNLGLTRMAEACSLATRRQLTWIAGWHLREETYGRALGLVDLCPPPPAVGGDIRCCARTFGSARARRLPRTGSTSPSGGLARASAP